MAASKPPQSRSLLNRVSRFLSEPIHRRNVFYWRLRQLHIRFVQIRVRDYRMWVDLADSVLGHHIYIHQEYEPFETSLFQRAAKPGMTVLDIGANTGFHTVSLARCVGPNGHVYAFEPDPTNFMLLKRNLQLNRLTNVTCEQAAVMGDDGTVSLHLSIVNFGDHRVFDADDHERFEEGTPRRTIEVPAIGLDKYVERLGIKPDLIKMDIQGAETFALPGMMQILSNPEVILFCEYWPYGLRQSGGTAEGFLQTLTKLGFDLFEIKEATQSVIPVDLAELAVRYPDLGLTNLICLHPGKNRSFLDSLLK